MNNNNRETNFELLRIVCMIMIVILHFNKYGLVLENVVPNTIDFYILNFLEYFCVIAVNAYVLITGYFMINKKIKIKKIIDFELELLFYTIFIYLALLLSNQISFNFKDMIKMFIPTLTGSYWFMSAYILLYIFIPYLNKFSENIPKKDYGHLLTLLTILLTLFASFLPIKSIININNGYSLIWFIYLYLLGGYIKLHSLRFLKQLKKYQLAFFYILNVIIMLGIFVIYNKFIDHESYMMFLAYNSPLILLNSLIIFYFFKNIKIKNKYANIISNLSNKTLAIYLVHLHPIFKTILWEKLFHPYQYTGTYQIYLALFIDIIIIFVMCYLIESVRQKLHYKLNFSTKITETFNID